MPNMDSNSSTIKFADKGEKILIYERIYTNDYMYDSNFDEGLRTWLISPSEVSHLLSTPKIMCFSEWNSFDDKSLLSFEYAIWHGWLTRAMIALHHNDE